MKKLNFLFITAVLLFTACGTPTKKQGCLPRSIAFSGETSDKLSSKSTEYYSYDNQGRLIKTEYSTSKLPSSYMYSKGKVKTTSDKTEGLEYTLDKDDRIVRAEKPGTAYSINVSYNEQGYISQLSLDEKNFTRFIYNAGTISSIEDVADKKKTRYQITSSTDTVKNNFLMGSLYFDLFSLVSYQSHFITKIYRDILGNMTGSAARISNLGFKKVDISSSDPAVKGSIDYQYQKDAAGNIISVTETFNAPKGVWRKFTYKVKYDCEQQ